MRLPDLPNGGSVPDSSPEMRQLAATTREAGRSLQEGLTALGQEHVKNQNINAHLAYSQGMEDVDAELRTRPAIPLQEVKQRLGPAFDQLPDEVKNQPKVPALDPKSGKPLFNPDGSVQTKDAEIPTYLVGHALFHDAAGKIMNQAVGNITVGEGWQNEFRRAATTDTMQRWGKLNEVMLHAYHRDMVDTRTRQILTAANGATTPEAWASVRAMVEGSRDIFGDDGQMKIRAMIGGMEQAKPADQALLHFYTDETDPKARAELREAAKMLADESRTGLISPEKRVALDRRVRVALDKADRLEQGNRVKDEGRKAFDQIMTDAGGDPALATELAKKIEKTDVFDEVDRRIKERMTQEENLRKYQDAPRIARLESSIATAGLVDKNAPDYKLLSYQGRAQVDMRLDAHKRSVRSEASDERRQQNELDRTREAEFDAFASRDMKGAIGADVGELYPDASPLAVARMKARQAKVGAEFQKDQGVGRQAFLDRVATEAERLKYSKFAMHGMASRADLFRTEMLNRYDAWREANPDVRGGPKPTDVDAMIGDAVQNGKTGPRYWQTETTKWEAERAGKSGEFRPEPPRQGGGTPARPGSRSAAPPPAAGSPPAAAPEAPAPKQQTAKPPPGMTTIDFQGKRLFIPRARLQDALKDGAVEVK